MTSHDGWSLILVEPDGTPISDLAVEARDARFTFNLRGPCEVAWSMDGHSREAAKVVELATDVIVMWEGQALTRCRVGHSSDNISAEGHAVEFSAVDYRGLLGRRFLRSDQTLSGDLTAVAWNLIDWTQNTNPAAGGNWGITRGLTATTATVTDRVIAAGKPVNEAVDELAVSYPGFDWEIDGNLEFNTWQFRGIERDFALEWGGNVTSVRRDVDSTEYGNHIRYAGDDTVAVSYQSVADLSTRPEGRIESSESDPDLKTSGDVSAAAQTWLVRHGTLLPGYQMGVNPGVWNPNRLWLGDLAPVAVRSGRLDVNSIERVEQITVTLSAEGVSQVDLGFGQLRRDLLQLVRAQSQKLATLNRR